MIDTTEPSEEVIYLGLKQLESEQPGEGHKRSETPRELAVYAAMWAIIRSRQDPAPSLTKTTECLLKLSEYTGE